MLHLVRKDLIARQISVVHSNSNAYAKPSASVSRSPCPALNALANQGYMYAALLIQYP